MNGLGEDRFVNAQGHRGSKSLINKEKRQVTTLTLLDMYHVFLVDILDYY